jgi:uncharacterized secreted repeat protein (TIGR03808 family)
VTIDRRNLLLAGAIAALPATPSPAQPAQARLSALGLDAANFGLHPGAPDDQSRIARRAIAAAAQAGVPLVIAPGVYRIGDLDLPSGAQLVGVRGATKFVLSQGVSLFAAKGGSRIALSGLVLDGTGGVGDPHRGLVHLEDVADLKIADCEIAHAGGNAIYCVGVEGQIGDTLVTNAAETAIHSRDARGLLIARNTIVGAGNNGIQVWRSADGDDGTIVADNRIEAIANRSGGSGQYGNAINVFRAANVIVRANRIRNCAFSAVRGNAASNLHIEGNAVSDAREVALYAEFGFEGAVIASNSVEGAAIGISVTNFNRGGRLAVVQGNLIRDLLPRRPAGTDPRDGAGIGIAVEADTAVSGNTIENAPFVGILLGFGRYLRDVAVTGNVVRQVAAGVAVSVTPGAGSALIANNIIAEFVRGAVVGMDRDQIVTGELAGTAAARYPQLTIAGNSLRARAA